MSADDGGARKKDRDPILLTGFVVLLLASVGVIGIFINDHYISSGDSSSAGMGSSVSVNYIGSYYGLYDSDEGVIFDTSRYNIAIDEAYPKSFGFNSDRKESDYKQLSFTLGSSTTYLQMFMNATLGKKAGDTVTVIIDPANGYKELTADQVSRQSMTGNTMKVTETMTLAKFKEIYKIEQTIPSTGSVNIPGIISPYGWLANATVTGNVVTVTHIPAVDQRYSMNDDVGVTVTDVTDGIMTLKYDIDFEISVSDVPEEYPDINKFVYPDESGDEYTNVKLVKIVIDNEELYITAVDDLDTPDVFVTKNTDENVGMYLFFTITVESVS